MSGAYYHRLPVKIGIVCDRFFYEAIEDAAEFVYLSPNTDRKTLASLDVLLIVSAWRGLLNDEWTGMLYDGHETNKRIRTIIEFCRLNGKKTVFLSKEDPPNYDYCVELAKCCDFVFTTAEECVPYYVKACGHENVFVTGFCINPRHHNPIGMRRKKKPNAAIFAGSWMEKYPVRCRDLQTIFDGVIASGHELTIYDRNYYKCGKPQYWYPKKYSPWLKPAIDHADLQNEHHSYDWAVNINTVKHSRSMYANRVYELQAIGNLLISNASPGMITRFPGVFVVRSPEEVGELLKAFSPDERYALQLAGIRDVMTADTCFERIAELLNAIGVIVDPPCPEVLVIADDLESCRAMFAAQSYPHKRLVAPGDVTEDVFRSSTFTAFFSSTVEYDDCYLQDTVNAFKYTDARYVTSGLGAEHEKVDGYRFKSRTVFASRQFALKTLLSFSDNEQLDNGYAIDRFCCGEKGAWTDFKKALAAKRARFAAKILPEDLPGETPEFNDWLKRRRQSGWMKRLPFPLNKIFGGIQCLKENGWRYTLLHTLDKARSHNGQK